MRKLAIALTVVIAVVTVVASAQAENDGYSDTVIEIGNYQRQFELFAREVCSISPMGLPNTGDDSWSQQPLMRMSPRWRSQINNAVAQQYLGSSYDCTDRRGTLVVGNREAVYNPGGKLVRVTEKGQAIVTVSYDPTGDDALITVSDGRQWIELVVVLNEPRASYYSDASLTLTANADERTEDKQYRGEDPARLKSFSIAQNELISSLNEGYKLISDKGTMINFALAAMVNPDTRDGLKKLMEQRHMSRENKKEGK